MASLTWFQDGTYTRKQLRQLIGAFLGGKLTTRPLGGQSGVTSPPILTVTSTTWTVGSFTGVLDVETDGTMGPSPFVFDGNTTGAVTASNAGFERYDLLSLTMADPATLPTLVYTAGSIATTLPATPANSIPFAFIDVPQTGHGSPTISLIAPIACAVGGVQQCASSAAYPNQPYGGQVVYDLALGYMLAWDAPGATWNAVGGDDTGWVPLSLNAGIVTNSLTPSIRKKNGVVYFRGDCKLSAGGNFLAATNYTIVVVGGVPAGSRPTGNYFLPIVSSGATAGMLEFAANGAVVLSTQTSPMGNLQFGASSYSVG